VLLFVVNGIITIKTINAGKNLSEHLSKVVDPSLQALDDFNRMMIESKMYTTNWVFLRYNQEDKYLLKKIHATDYTQLKLRINSYAVHWLDKKWADSLHEVFTGFEELLGIEKNIMGSLTEFSDYDDPVTKLTAESKIEEEVLPRTTALLNSLSRIDAHEHTIGNQQNKELEERTNKLRVFIISLAISIFCIGISLSIYMSKLILSPINKIMDIVNDLGKGIINKVNYTAKKDEIGDMVNAVNNLSEKLQRTANFAYEIGSRNFDTIFQPLSDEDTLGKALIDMRDNLNKSGHELLEANAEIQTIYNASLDAVIIIDEEGRVVKWDNKSVILFGWNEDEVLGTLLTETIIPHQYREAHKKGMKHFLKTGNGPVLNKTIEITALRKDHSEFDISLNISPVLIKNKSRFIGFIRDITSRKKAEAKLHKSEADLEIKNKELIRKNTELEQFAFVASHDLQEPLRTISGFVELLQQQYHGRLDEKADKCLSYIVQSSDRMKIFVNDLLQYSRIGSKQENEQVNCMEMLGEVLADLGKTIDETHAYIDADQLPVINGHGGEIKQLFQNLIVNAIKFRKKDSNPEIKISAEREGEFWQFKFADNGIGIEEQHKERIFVIFQRLHTRSEYLGSGIGLSNCKKIVELHNGRIWVDSKPGIGSTFQFTIPVNNN
jgi:PAS domain S-box-containing protein